MPCISALKHESFIYFACDSQYTDTRAHFHTTPSWIKFQNSIVAVSGDSYIKTLIETACPYRGIDNEREDVLAYLLELKTSIPNDLNFTILIGGNSYLYQITDSFELIEIEQYSSIGSGQDFAIGSLYSTNGNPQTRVETSVRAAIMGDPFSGGEIFTDRI